MWVWDQRFGGDAVFQKKGSRDEAVEIPRYFSRLRRSWRLRRQISLDYITTAPPPNLTRQLRRLHGFMQIELILKCEKLLINKLISLFYMETIVLLLPLTIPAEILNHFAFGKAKAANWEIKGTRIFKLVPVRNRKKRRRSEQRKIEKRTLSLSVLTILRYWVGLYNRFCRTFVDII